MSAFEMENKIGKLFCVWKVYPLFLFEGTVLNPRSRASLHTRTRTSTVCVAGSSLRSPFCARFWEERFMLFVNNYNARLFWLLLAPPCHCPPYLFPKALLIHGHSMQQGWGGGGQKLGGTMRQHRTESTQNFTKRNCCYNVQCTKYHKYHSRLVINNRNVFFHCCGDWKSEIGSPWGQGLAGVLFGL